MLNPRPNALPTRYNSTCTNCNAQQEIANLAQKLGLGLSQSEIAQMVGAITAGGQAGMALAVTIANMIADSNYQVTQLTMNDMLNTLNSGGNSLLPISPILKSKLSKITIKR